MLDPDEVGFALFFGIVLIGTVLLSRLLNSATSSTNLRSSQVVFRTPRVILVMQIMFFLLLPVFGLSALPKQIASVLAEHDSLSVTLGWSAAFAASFVGVPLLIDGVLMGTVPGPQELRLDKNQRTYNLWFGTFLKRRFRSGSWEDIEGVYVKQISVKGSISYGVYVAWHQGLSGRPFLALAGEKEQAERMAGEIAQEVGWQVVSQPVVTQALYPE